MAKPDLLLIGEATDRMMAAMAEHFTVHAFASLDDSRDWIAGHGGQVGAMAVCGHAIVDDKLLDDLPNLKIVSNFGVGYDHIDARALAGRGVIVTHTPDVLNAEVANTALMLWLAVSRCLLRDDAYLRSGKWAEQGDAPLTRSVENRKVGILGLGRIGEEIAGRLQVFGADVSYHSRREKPDMPYRYYADLADMARDVDTLICVAPGGAATRHLVNRKVIEALGPDGTLINVGRGSVVDEAELVAALRDGRLGNAGLDVFEHEPQVPQALRDLENVVLLPHVGSATVETRQAMGDLVTENLIRWLKDGRPVSPVPECRDL